MHVAKAITSAEYIRLTFIEKCVLNMLKVLKKEKLFRFDILSFRRDDLRCETLPVFTCCTFTQPVGRHIVSSYIAQTCQNQFTALASVFNTKNSCLNSGHDLHHFGVDVAKQAMKHTLTNVVYF